VATSHSSSILLGAAAVSDQIRHISQRAFLMQLHATNALVMTRSRGIRVPGFETVSEQMGQLSRELGAALAVLRGATVAWLRVVSHDVATERTLAAYDSTARMSPAAARAIAPIIARIAAEHASSTDTPRARRAFAVALDEVRQLAAIGCVLARTARLEATDGGGLAESLGEAANEFAVLADAVDDSVRTIARRSAQRGH